MMTTRQCQHLKEVWIRNQIRATMVHPRLSETQM